MDTSMWLCKKGSAEPVIHRPRAVAHLWLCLTGSAAALGISGCDDSGGTAPQAVLGRTGVGPGEFNYPRAVALAPDGGLYVVDKAGRIQRITQQGEFELGWRLAEIERGKPTGLGVAPDGRVFAADTHYHRVLIFESDGRLAGEFGSAGDGPGQFRLPTDVAVDREGFVYVSEYGGNDRISKFTPRLEYMFSFDGGESGVRVERPQSLCLDPDGALWVADACNHRICQFDREGRLVRAFGRPGVEPGELRFPYNVDVLADGTLVVCEYGNNRVQRFSRDGRSLGTWGSAGRQPGKLAYPWALVVGAGDRVFIVDSGNNRIQVIAGRGRGTWRAALKS
jgi:DNA-binding beta-propeller fold protein YncE